MPSRTSRLQQFGDAREHLLDRATEAALHRQPAVVADVAQRLQRLGPVVVTGAWFDIRYDGRLAMECGLSGLVEEVLTRVAALLKQ